MEEKLLELKEHFCKWYCPNKLNGVRDGEGSNFDPDFVCWFCMVDKYIEFSRDELNK